MRLPVSQPASIKKNSGHGCTANSSLHEAKLVKLALMQCQCHTGKQFVNARITSIAVIGTKLLTSGFLEIFVRISRKGQMPILTPSDAHGW